MGALSALLALRDGWLATERLVLVAPPSGIPDLARSAPRSSWASASGRRAGSSPRAARRTGYAVEDLDARAGRDRLEYERPSCSSSTTCCDREVAARASARLVAGWPGAELLLDRRAWGTVGCSRTPRSVARSPASPTGCRWSRACTATTGRSRGRSRSLRRLRPRGRHRGVGLSVHPLGRGVARSRHRLVTVARMDFTADEYARRDADRLREILAGPPVTWVFLGDSITQGVRHTHGRRGYVEHFAERVRGELGRRGDAVINSGVSGTTTEDLLPEFHWRAGRFAPDVVFVMFGTNDMTAGRGRRARLPLPPRPDRPALPRRGRHGRAPDPAAGARRRRPRPRTSSRSTPRRSARSASDLGVLVVDHAAAWARGRGGSRRDVAADGWLDDAFHPSARGHHELALTLFATSGSPTPSSDVCSLVVDDSRRRRAPERRLRRPARRRDRRHRRPTSAAAASGADQGPDQGRPQQRGRPADQTMGT